MAPCNILIWNARGLNNKSRRDMVHQIVQSCQPAIVCLQETKLAHISVYDASSILGQGFHSFVYLPARETRGGILVAWREDVFTAECHRVHRHSVSVKFRSDGEHEWWFSGIYGPHLDADKPAFLEELREVRSQCNGPWMLAGDFNMIFCAEDKNNDNVNRAMMGRFRRFVNDMELKEIPLLGRRYTWSNERDSPTLVKLDRVLCTSDWEDIYPDCVLQSHASEMSDHCPLILGLKDGVYGKRRFHFESYWTQLPGFLDTVKNSWDEPVRDAGPFERISIKLKRLTRALQSWSAKKVGHIKTQLALAREVLHRLEMAQDRRQLSPEEDWLRRELKRYCLSLASFERTIARLRSRVRYIKEGDANTSFFHKQAAFRKRKNFISKLIDGDFVATAQEDKQEIMHTFYENLIGNVAIRSSTLDLQAFHRPGLDLSMLDSPITEEEVWATIKTLPSDRAPGPDGYTGRFYKECWPVIKADFMAAIITLQQGNARGLGLLNGAYMTLIPKKLDAAMAKDFRPISLMHSFAKLVTKILANRLAPHLNSMVATNQSAFIRGRSIHDNFILVQQTVKILHRQKVPSLFLKLDISKAFDSVSWSFLLEVLAHLGFGRLWCNLISNLLSTSSTRILLNGEPGESIQHQRGLRQGDPLSPMLFILVMDVLNSLFVKAGEEGLLQPLSPRISGQRLSLYADDVALFIKPVDEELQVTRDLLNVFGAASGLQTNLHKSSIIPIQCEDGSLSAVSNTLPCTISDFPCTYLGLPLSHKKLRKNDLMPWIEKVADKLPGWKASLMNRAGRITMVRFVLSAVPIYLLIAINVPKWFIKAIDKIRRGFLWKGREQANGGCCLVAWEKVMRPLDLGGLGIINLEVMAWALQARWQWHKKTRVDRPWTDLELPSHPNSLALFAIAVKTELGNGNTTLFWSDNWLHGTSVENLAPLVFASVPPRIRKRQTMADALTNNGWVAAIRGGLSWVGIREFLKLWDCVQGIVLNEQEDRHIWKLDAKGCYSSKSAYRSYFLGSVTFEPWKRLWKSWAPNKCKVFLWLAIRNRCWTADRLAKRGLPHPDRCPLCDQEGETVQHLLVSCVVARQVWFNLLQPLNLGDYIPRQQECSFAEWWRKLMKRVKKEYKRGVNSLIILGAWLLWNHRNACVFEGVTPSVSAIMCAFKDEHSLWCLAGAKKLQGLGLANII